MYRDMPQYLCSRLTDLTAFGDGSWADDDFDPSSISVPLMAQRPHHDNFAHHQPHFGNMPPRGGPPPGHFAVPGGPPYIVKLSNVPAYFGNEHLEELFESRFMKYVKFKLVYEVDHERLRMSANPGDAVNKRKKVAFVELVSSADFDKVLRWTDVYVDNGYGKIRVDAANFDDFKMHMDINQSVQEKDDPSVSLSKRRSSNAGRSPVQQFTLLHRPPPAPHAINNNNIHPPSLQQFPPRAIPQQNPIREHPLPPLHPPSPAPPPKKSNPFGNAKPVDTLSKQLELEKSLQSLEINSTTFRTLGHQQETSVENRPKTTQKPPSPQQKKPSPPSPKKRSSTPVAQSSKPELRPASQPTISAWGSPTPGATFSDVASPPKNLLGLHIEEGSRSSSYSKKKPSTPDDTSKTVVLKRKHTEPRKSRIASPEVKDVPEETEVKNGPKKGLLKKLESLDDRLEDELKKEDINGETKKTETKKENPKKVRTNREKAKKDASAEDPKITSDERKASISMVNLSTEEKDALRKEKRKQKDKLKRERKKADRENAKSDSNSTEDTPDSNVPVSNDNSTSNQLPKSTKKTDPKPTSIGRYKVTESSAETTEAPRSKSKRGRGGRGGSRAPTRDSSISPDKPTEGRSNKPPASAPSMATGVNAIAIDGSNSDTRPSTARGRGGSRGRGGRARGRGQKVYHNLTQTYNQKSDSKPE